MDALFSWWQYDFMRSALFAVLLIMPLFALLGTMVVNNGMAFFSDALGHSALTGVGIGVLLGMTRYSAVMVVFAIVFALLMNRIRHSRLSVSYTHLLAVQYYAEAETLFSVSRGSFLPAPNVDSAVIRLTVRKTPPCAVRDEALLFRLIRSAFGQRRKTLPNALVTARCV